MDFCFINMFARSLNPYAYVLPHVRDTQTGANLSDICFKPKTQLIPLRLVQTKATTI